MFWLGIKVFWNRSKTKQIDMHQDLYRELWKSLQIRCFGYNRYLPGDSAVHQDFKDYLSRSKDGWYKTGLNTEDNFASLKNNKLGSLGRLKKFTKKSETIREL